MKSFRVVATALLAALSSMVFAQSALEQAKSDELAFMSSEEPAMRKAFERARGSLNVFLRQAAAPRQGTEGYALKVAISDGRNTEYFWVTGFSAKGEIFSGHLGNEPRMVKKYKLDERFDFHRKQIVDWTYIDTTNKRMFGNFTACALLTKEPRKQAEEFKKEYGLSCD